MRRVLWTIVIALLFAACGGSDSYRINGVLQGVAKGTVVTLVSLDGEVPEMLDSTRVAGSGKFHFAGQTDTCRLALVVFEADDNLAGCQFFLESGKIDLTYDVETYRQRVSGTVCNDAFQNFYEESLILDDQVMELQDKLQMTVVSNGDGHTLIDQLNALQVRFRDLVAQSINDNVDNLFGYEQMQQYFDLFEPDENLAFLRKLEPYFSSDMAFLNMLSKLRKQLPTSVGRQFVNFEADRLDSKNRIAAKQAKLSDFVSAGKLVYLDFWASYIPACINQIPTLKAALDKYQSKGFQIVSISADDEASEWVKAVKDNEMTWPQLWNGFSHDDSSAVGKYAVTALPMSFLIDSDGTIIGRNLLADELEEVLADYFK